MLMQYLRCAMHWTMPSTVLALLLCAQALAAEEHQHQALGKVHFPVTCSSEAQAAFDQAMKLQHSFWYQAAGVEFKRVLNSTRPASWRIGDRR
jgi:hypothetical protein